jgi:hypothetical protein
MILDQTISLSQILVALLTLITAALGYVVREQREKIKNIQNQLSEKKYKVYNDIYTIFFDLFKQQKGIVKKEKIEDMGLRMIDIKKELFIYAPDVVLTKFLEWNNIVSNDSSNKKHFKVYLELFILIRKDMGHKKTKISANDVLKSIVLTNNDYRELLKMME